MTLTRYAFRSALRDAAVDLVKAYAASAGVDLQAYPGRPASLYPPTAFVDAIDERIEMVGPVRRRRIPTLDLVVVHGLFDSADAVDAADGFVDGFLEYTLDRAHAAGVNTLFAITATKDEPGYVPVWLSPDRQRAYYATVFSLEGLSLD